MNPVKRVTPNAPINSEPIVFEHLRRIRMRLAVWLVILQLICWLCLPVSLAQDNRLADRPVKDKWALVVGISQFKNPQINLRFAAKDAEDFYNYLVTDGGFARDHVKLLLDQDATEKHIMSELGSKWLPHTALPDDLVVIFISSHGSPSEMDPEGVNYIVAHDTEIDDLYTTGIEMQDFVTTIRRRVHADRIVVILDACHSGAVEETQAKGIKRTWNVDAEPLARGTGQIVICSSKPNERSWEFKNDPNSVFTRCLIDGLRQTSKLGDAYQLMKDKVQDIVVRERGVLQTPVLKNEGKANAISLSVKASNPRPGLSEAPAVAVTPPPAAATTPATSDQTTATAAAALTPTTPATAVVPAVATPPPTPAAAEPPVQPPTSTAQSAQPPAAVAALSSPLLIALLPFNGPVKSYVDPCKGQVILWGQVKSADELKGLPRKVNEHLYRCLRKELGQEVAGPRTVKDGLVQAGLLNDAAPANFTALSPDECKRIGKAVQVRYLVSGTVLEANWGTSVWANKYTLVISAKLLDTTTGQVVSEVKEYKVQKAPFHGDVGGGRQYFEGEVAKEAANYLCRSFSRNVGKR